MGIMNFLGLGDEIAKPINAVSNLYTTDKAQLEAEKDLQVELNKPIVAQLENNKIMASSNFFFNSGWQPLIGWTAGFLILLYYFPQITLATYVWGKHCVLIGEVTPFPIRSTDIVNLVYLVFGFGVQSIFTKNKTP